MQLLVASLLCVILPWLIQTWSLPVARNKPEADHSALTSLAALFGGFWLHRSVASLPGTRESSGILPGFLASYGLALTIILLFRIDYSRALLVVGFVMSVAWFFLIYAVTQRKTQLVLGVVGGGRTGLFDDMSGVEVVPLDGGPLPEEVDAVTADFRHDHSDEWEARLADYTLAGIPVYHSKDLYESLTGRADLEHLSENTFGALGPMASLLEFKMILDRLVALPFAIVLLPLFAVTAVAIKLDSPGPVFFRQRRMGYRGQEFTVIKFRTMREDRKHPRTESANPGVEQFITRENDRRITRLGRFLRRTRIDELPQVFNVLAGQMSWIGPRPEASQLSEWYQAEIPFYRYRHVVRPGITGWAQVNQGHVAEIDDIRTKLQYDFYYIRNFSLWLDILIVVKTIRTVFTGFGHK
ncbi:sugar transferase [Novosphingobium sp. TH158]|uniref:sugar transferase n=1 Tax=Novosphingobium sp. TH158 TaxID=2067455 RepID=UPI00130453FD|nr:sugar transferase [Novosphingobium sp. TH158]